LIVHTNGIRGLSQRFKMVAQERGENDTPRLGEPSFGAPLADVCTAAPAVVVSMLAPSMAVAGCPPPPGSRIRAARDFRMDFRFIFVFRGETVNHAVGHRR
jgi:hypothetical protein